MTKKFSLLVAGLLLAPLAGVTRAEDKVDFAKQVEPILKETCYSCHGPEKQKGKLRLDSLDAFKKGGENGPVVTAGDPAKSDLYHRVTLPKDDDDIMPPKGDPLKKEQTDLIAAWIKQGASFGDWKGGGTATAGAAPGAAAPAGPAKIDLPQVAAADAGALEKVRGTGALAMPLAQGVNLLDVSFQSAGDKMSDNELGLLTPVASQVYSLNLAGSKVTDAGLSKLSDLKNLRRLHLEKTGITDAGLANLKGLSNLEYLNLYGTKVTDAGLSSLEGLKNLKSLYLWQSKVTDAGVDKLKKALPNTRIDNGWKEPATQPTTTTTAAKDEKKDDKKKDDAKTEVAKKDEKKDEKKPAVADAKKAEEAKNAETAKADEAKKTEEAKKSAEAKK
jgi:mono/diheme cytochrome c family protein